MNALHIRIEMAKIALDYANNGKWYKVEPYLIAQSNLDKCKDCHQVRKQAILWLAYIEAFGRFRAVREMERLAQYEDLFHQMPSLQ